MNYHAGQLDQRISLQRRTMTRDGGGGADESWSTYATVSAMVRPMTGREREVAMREEARADYLVVLRYRNDILETDRILWRGRYLDIHFPKDLGPRTAWLELECEKGAST